jgi:uncharacterized protein involved in exopolysaccharide biosynthesis
VGLGLLAGFAWSLQQPSTYSATASVALNPVPKYVTDPTTELVPPEVSIDTDAQLLRSPRVLGAIGAVLDRDPEEASAHLSVTASPLSHVLHVTVRARSGQLAAKAANAAVAAFIDVRRSTLPAFQQDQLSQLRFYISNQERLLAKQQARRVVIPARDDLFAQLTQLRASLEELEAAYRNPADPLSPAVAPQRADYPNTEVPLMSGAMLGLLGACLVGAARDRARLLSRPLSSRLRTPFDDLPDPTNRQKDYRHAV